MARGFLGRKDRSPGTPKPGSSGSTAPTTPTPDGSGTRLDRGMSPLTAKMKSSTGSSDSGSATRASSTDRLYKSILDQDRELRYARQKAAWILMHPKTQSEIMAEDSVIVSLGKTLGPGDTIATMIAGIPVKAVTWMPENIVVVTPSFEEGIGDSFKSFYELFVSGPTSSGTYVPLVDWTTVTTTTVPESFKGLSYSFKASGAPFTVPVPEAAREIAKEGKPKPVPPVVDPGPDPESIYGKALARAKEEARLRSKK